MYVSGGVGWASTVEAHLGSLKANGSLLQSKCAKYSKIELNTFNREKEEMIKR